MVNGIHAKEEGNNAVAPINSRQRVRVNAFSGQRLPVEIKTVALANGEIQVRDRRFVSEYLVEEECFLNGEPANVGGFDPDGIFRAVAAFKKAVGSQFVTHNLEESVVCGSITSH